MIQAGIIGGGGYTAGELIRILQFHPDVEIKYVFSNSQQGKAVSSVHQDLLGECFLTFSGAFHFDLDVVFLCMGHEQSIGFLEDNPVPDQVAVIDLSRDFRLRSDYVYGLPELNRSDIRQRNRIANPGCFATTIQLALLPLAADRALQDEIHIHAITGSTGAGQKPGATTHFSWRNNNVSVYKAFRHQHLDEIKRSLRQLQDDFEQPLHFIPVRGNFTRGIFASLYTTVDATEAEMKRLYEDYYETHPFVVISNDPIHLKMVVNTNKCILQVEKHEDKLLILSTIDNLVKGASGQAVQNMNLLFGLEETAGLNLKSVGF